MRHTPGPWEVKYIGRNVYIEPKDHKGFIADLQYTECQSEDERGEALANAALIVRAVNSHAALLEALQKLEAVNGHVSISNGVATFEDGTYTDLRMAIAQATNGESHV